MKRNRLALSGALALFTMTATTATAGLVLPASEDFSSGNANWFDATGVAGLDWVAAGGADGGGYVTAGTVVPDPVPEFGLILFRAHDEFGSSGGAFEGNWLAAGVTQFTFSIRHDGFAPLNAFARFAGPDNFPGAAGLSFVPILPGVWTDVTIDIDAANPAIVLEGLPFEAVFSNIGHVQIGILPGEDLAGANLTVDLDRVAAVPGAGAWALFGLAGLGGRRRREP